MSTTKQTFVVRLYHQDRDGSNNFIPDVTAGAVRKAILQIGDVDTCYVQGGEDQIFVMTVINPKPRNPIVYSQSIRDGDFEGAVSNFMRECGYPDVDSEVINDIAHHLRRGEPYWWMATYCFTGIYV